MDPRQPSPWKPPPPELLSQWKLLPLELPSLSARYLAQFGWCPGQPARFSECCPARLGVGTQTAHKGWPSRHHPACMDQPPARVATREGAVTPDRCIDQRGE